jgi:hypothetical protein
VSGVKAPLDQPLVLFGMLEMAWNILSNQLNLKSDSPKLVIAPTRRRRSE